MARNHLTIGISATGEITPLYCGPDRAAAKAALEKPSGAVRTELYLFIPLSAAKDFPVEKQEVKEAPKKR